MQLKYRGISYNAPNTPQTLSTAVIAGKYHGIKTLIPLPQVTERTNLSLRLLVYRGTKLATV